MQKLDFGEKLDLIVQQDPRYDREAYLFLRDALDYMGVLAYFPLTKTENPSAEEISTAWEKRCAELAKYSKQNGKQFLFVEIGYNESSRAAAEARPRW